MINEGSLPADTSYATLHGLFWLVVNLSQHRPLLLSVDDLQWVDAPSQRFIVHLLPRVVELPVVLVLAGRTADLAVGVAPDAVAQLVIAPQLRVVRPLALTESGASALVRDALGPSATAPFCTACHEVSGGNPFLLQSLVADLATEQVSPDDASVERVHRMTPDVVSASVLLRLARHDAAAVALARAVGVLGAATELRLAARLAELDPDAAADAAGALIRSGVLSGDRALGFVHPLLRSAVLSDLSGPELSRWHHRAARMFDDEGFALQSIAPHLIASVPAGDEWTVGRLRAAALDAAKRGACDIAADCLRRALAEPPSTEVRPLLLIALGRLVAREDPAAAIAHFEDALAGVEVPALRAEVSLALGEALTFSGRLDTAVQVLRAGLEAETGDDPTRHAGLLAALLAAARWDAGSQELRSAIARGLVVAAASSAELDPLLHCQLAIETVACGADRASAVFHACRALETLDGAMGVGASVFPEVALVLVFADEPQEAARRIDVWLDMARREVWPLGIAMGATCGSLAALYRGDVGEAVAMARDAVAGNAEIRLAPITVAFLVEALIERSEVALAAEELQGRDLEGPLPGTWAMTPLLLARGRLRAAAGDHRSAVDDLMEVGRRCERWGLRNPAMAPWRSSVALPLMRIGDQDRAVRLAEEEVALARAWGTARGLGVALRTSGMCRDGESGVSRLAEAVAVLETSPAPLELARALTEYGAALRRRGQRIDARANLGRALDLAHRRGGIAVAGQARDELAAAGARPRRAALRGRDALTPSELRVARLAAAGRTNREIAEGLFLTLRTVETHLTSTYGKLGITSRGELSDTLGTAEP